MSTLAVMGDLAASVRVCKECGVEKPPFEFYRRSDGHLDLHCKECVRARSRSTGTRSRRAQGVGQRWRAACIWVGGVEVLPCRRCRTWKARREFTSAADSPVGVMSTCKQCNAEKQRASWLAKRGGRPAQRRVRDPEARRRALHRYNTGRGAQKRREDPERYRLYQQRRAARKRNAAVNDLTQVQWEGILRAYGHSCAYCERDDTPMTQEHMVPLVRGGGHTATNVVPACRSCNSRKRTRTPEEWAAAGGPSLRFLIEGVA